MAKKTPPVEAAERGARSADRKNAQPRPPARRDVGGATIANHEPDPVKANSAVIGAPSEGIDAAGAARIQQTPGDAFTRIEEVGIPAASNDPRPSEAERDEMDAEPSEEEIRIRAYHMYLERGAEHGGHFDDWLRAEQELRRKK